MQSQYVTNAVVATPRAVGIDSVSFDSSSNFAITTLVKTVGLYKPIATIFSLRYN
jgi:hypothetical protein